MSKKSLRRAMATPKSKNRLEQLVQQTLKIVQTSSNKLASNELRYRHLRTDTIYKTFLRKNRSASKTAKTLGISVNCVYDRFKKTGLTLKEKINEQVAIELYKNGLSVMNVAKRLEKGYHFTYDLLKRTSVLRPQNKSTFKEEHAVRLYKKHRSVQKVAAILHCDSTRLSRILSNAGMIIRTQKRCDLPLEELIEKYEQGRSFHSLARDYGVDGKTIYIALIKSRIDIYSKANLEDLSEKIKKSIIVSKKPYSTCKKAGLSYWQVSEILVQNYKVSPFVKAICRKYDSRTGIKRIAKESGIQESTVILMLAKAGSYIPNRGHADEQFIIDNYNPKLGNSEEVAKKAGCHRITLYRVLEKYNVPRWQKPRKKFEQEVTQKIIEEYKSGTSLALLTRKYDCSDTRVIKRLLSEHGVRIRNKKEQGLMKYFTHK